MKWLICDLCGGDGHYVNPAIDAGGLSAEDLNDDPDFAERYLSGVYDVQCHACGGTGKVRAYAEDRTEERRQAAREDGDVEAYLTASDRRWP